MQNKLRIVFLGTPDFAAESLRAILAAEFQVVAVITAPDRPKGRGRTLQPSAVKALALQHDLPVLQPTNLKDETFLEELRSFQADLQVVVAFRMLPVAVWDMPAMGTYNLHASMLPDYRGAAPINWAIMNGETETGVTTFKLKHEIDTGSILFQAPVPIDSQDTAGDLHDKLMTRGAELLVESIHHLHDNPSPDLHIQHPLPNHHHAPKLFKEDMKIDWNQSSEQIRNFVRGLAPYPAAWTVLDKKTLKIYEVMPSKENPGNLPVGSFKVHQKRLLVRTGDGWLDILNLQLEGKKRMDTETFLLGYQFSDESH